MGANGLAHGQTDARIGSADIKLVYGSFDGSQFPFEAANLAILDKNTTTCVSWVPTDLRTVKLMRASDPQTSNWSMALLMAFSAHLKQLKPARRSKRPENPKNPQIIKKSSVLSLDRPENHTRQTFSRSLLVFSLVWVRVKV